MDCCGGCGCCGGGQVMMAPGIKINTFTSFTVMMLSLVSGIIGFSKQINMSLTVLSFGLIVISLTILGLMVFPRISRNE